MSLGSTAVRPHSAKVGTCPHGLPLGACPICNGMAGGNSTTKRDTPRNVGEMSYNQCAAIGAMLRAQKHARAQAQQAQQNHLQALANFQKTIANTHQRLVEFATMVNNTMPAIIAKPVNFVLTQIVGRVLTVIQNLPTTIANFTQMISQKFTEISDKLAAVYGELKAAVEEKVSKFFTETKKKLKSLLFVFGTQETDDEDKKIDEAKRTFELKTFIHKMYKKLKGEDEKDIEQDAH
jgi:nitrate/nitrite-specific signal transduction histidine kinase